MLFCGKWIHDSWSLHSRLILLKKPAYFYHTCTKKVRSQRESSSLSVMKNDS